jgi:oxygen-independent coproporphyrinogen-3 oxidase
MEGRDPAAYADALLAELNLRRGDLVRVAPVATLYVGGGTPTCIPESVLCRIIQGLTSALKGHAVAEVTVEANPGTLDEQYARALLAAGVTRLSLGFQSMNGSELAALGRIHRTCENTSAFRAARKAGFSDINVDLMIGVPGQTQSSFQATYERVFALRPEHISAYMLAVEDRTPLAEALARGVLRLPDEDETADMYESFVRESRARGYVRYEVSNFALPGHECRHNMGYWRNSSYLGLGVAAHSHFAADGERVWNTSDPDEYARRVGSGEIPVAGREIMGADGERIDRIILGLRTRQGVAEEDLEGFGHVVRALVEAGLVTRAQGRVALTEKGFLLGNRVFQEFV